MSNKNVYQAVREAMGDQFLKPESESGLSKRANELKDVFPDATHDELVIEAIKEAYGTGQFSPNVSMQVADRVKVLNKEGEDAPPAPGTEKPRAVAKNNKQDLGLVHNQGENVGTDAGKPEKADSILGDEKNINAQQKKAFEEGKTTGGGGNNPGLSAAPIVNSQVGPAGPGASHTR